jgi:Spy/CpxP family protein refolding chaperone
MKRKIVPLGLVVIVFLGVTYVVYAQGAGSGPGASSQWGKRSHWRSWEPGKGLNLTPEQKATFREMRRKFMGENAQLIGALVTKRLELRSLWTDTNSNPEAILAKEKELRDLQNQMRDKVVQGLLEARKTLTPEQLSKFGANWGMGRGGMVGRGHGMGFGW